MSEEFPSRTGEAPPDAPANAVVPGRSDVTDRPSVDLFRVVAGYEQLLEDASEIRERPIPGVDDRDGRQAYYSVREAFTPAELKERTDRFSAWGENVIRIGNRLLADTSHQLTTRASELIGELEAIDAGLGEMIPSGRDLGEIGEYSAEEYMVTANGLWERREQAVNALKVLLSDHERYQAKRRPEDAPNGGPYLAGLEFLNSQPEMARRFAELLMGGAPVEPLDYPAAKYEEPDLDRLSRLRERTIASLNAVENVARALEDRDAMRVRATAKRDERTARQFPAMRGRTRMG